jgi:hypothetical protein
MKQFTMLLAIVLFSATIASASFKGSYSEKTTPAGTDVFLIENTGSTVTNWVSFSNFVANYLDALYASTSGPTFTGTTSIATLAVSVGSTFPAGDITVEDVETHLKTNTLEWVYTDISATTATVEDNVIRIPTGATWGTAYTRCNGAEAVLVFSVYYHATGGTMALLDTVPHNSTAATDTEDLSGNAAVVAGSYVGVDITTAGTVATACTLAIDLITN